MRVLIVLLLSGMIGCATLNKETCLSEDWYQVGFADGRNGFLTERIIKHDEACAKYDISPDEPSYLQGHTAGLTEYCTPEGGYRAGSLGYRYNNLCAGEGEAEFLKSYRRGYSAYRYERCLVLQHHHYFASYGYGYHHRYHAYYWPAYSCRYYDY
ncbi:DUF2799 domain-containing protein [Marinobacterium jannaschii]|uniref:DUF2799 domain-containing protein n=1 Tax=Marinobacterium jannaschii TaxID=64970 RepID=UPI00068587CD|nr:DUF2799 domain-containing protein [Marinobacterium jannaschii]